MLAVLLCQELVNLYTSYRTFDIVSYQLNMKKMRTELANLNHCAVPFLSRAAVNLSWYYYTMYVDCRSNNINERNFLTLSVIFFPKDGIPEKTFSSFPSKASTLSS